LDAAGNAVVMGGTRSLDFPVTPGAFDTHCECVFAGDPDMFIAKISADGTTTSNNFPVTLDANQPLYGTGGDAFVGKLSPDFAHMVYGSYIGGHGHAG